MARSVLVVGCCMLLVLAGCSTLAPSESDRSLLTSPTEPPAEQDVSTSSANSLVVSIDGPATDWQNFTPLVNNALRYWESNGSQYLDKDVQFILQPDSPDPDIRIRFLNGITPCGPAQNAAGYATHLNATTDKPMVVCVGTEYSDGAVVRLLKHEFGHLLDLVHGDGPPVMDSTNDYLRLPTPRPAVQQLVLNRSTITGIVLIFKQMNTFSKYHI
ncbi:MAG: hypothetical protein ABEI76_04405 [Halobacteriales archaeon]